MEAIILSVLTPVAVFLATKLALWVKPNVPAVIVTTFIVPLLTGLATWISSMVNPNLAWYYAAGISLASTFIYEFLKNLKTFLGFGK